MSYYNYKLGQRLTIINKYIGNSNYEKDFLYELSEELPDSQFDEIIKKS